MLQTLGQVVRPAPLLTTLATAALLAAAVKTAPFGLALGALLLSWLARYSIAALESLGTGAREMPVLSLEMIFGTKRGWGSFLWMFGLVCLSFSTGTAAIWLGMGGAIAVGILAALVLPMALVTLGWTSESSAAVDPRMWLHFARALGSGFIYLEVIGVLVVAASALLLSGAIHMNLILKIAVAIFGWLLLVALAGATVNARRADLAAATEFYRGIELPPSPAAAARLRQEFIDGIYAQWRSGTLSQAWDGIVRQAAAANSPADEYRWIYQQVLAWDAPTLATRIAQELVRLDLLAGRSGYALRVARARLEADGQFQLRAARDTLALARLAAENSDNATALALLATFNDRAADEGSFDAARELHAMLEFRAAPRTTPTLDD